MKVKLYVDSGANIHSRKEMIFDLDTEAGQSKMGISKEDWLALSETEKDEFAKEWADNYITIGFEEL